MKKMAATRTIPVRLLALATMALLAIAVATTAHAQSANKGRFAAYQASDTTPTPPVLSLPRTAPSTYSQPRQPLPPLPAEEFRARDIAPLAASPACDAVPHIPAAAPQARPAMVTYRPLVPLVAMPRTYRVGRGILGQPKLYVPGQVVRNAFRYLTP